MTDDRGYVDPNGLRSRMRAPARRVIGKVLLAGVIAVSTAVAGISASSARGGGMSMKVGMMGPLINKPPRPKQQ